MNSKVNVPDYLKPQIEKLDKQIAQAKELLGDPGLKEAAETEIKKLESDKKVLLDSLVGNQNPNRKESANTDPHNACILEVRSAAGGEEAKIWADDLTRMYLRFANNQGWAIEQLDERVLKIICKNVFDSLKYESGVHRVQRIPVTESQGRIHTSTATVVVLPVLKEADIKINPNDLNWQFFRASGHGGQNVNKVSTAVRLTHQPSGVAVVCRQERFQEQNRQIALELLRGQLWQIEENRRLSKITDSRRDAVGRGMRAEKIRTYNYPQNRITDHRIKKSWHNLEEVLDGKLEKIIEYLLKSLG